jgi:hypothetical protein
METSRECGGSTNLESFANTSVCISRSLQFFPMLHILLVKLQNVAVRIELIVEVRSHSYPVKVDEVI